MSHLSQYEMIRILTYIGQWLSDWYAIFVRELKHIFSDSGVLIIFFLAGLAYPALYGIIYSNGTLDDMPVAVVDESGSRTGRKFLRKLDATREVNVSRSCANMAEAERLMQQREVHGIVLIPSDFEERLASGQQAGVSVYADMSSFIYYKNLTMAVNMVMLDEMHGIQEARLSDAGMGSMADRLIHPIRYVDTMPYNRAMSYSVFFLSAVLLVIIQQTMYFGVSMLSGTMREEHRSFAVMPDRLQGRGISRTVLGRGAAYWLLYMGIGIYVAVLAPRMIGLPQNCPFGDILVLLIFFVSLLAGKQFPGFLEMVFIHFPVDFRRPRIHEHEHSRGRAGHGRTADNGSHHTDHSLLYPVMRGSILRKQDYCTPRICSVWFFVSTLSIIRSIVPSAAMMKVFRRVPMLTFP